MANVSDIGAGKPVVVPPSASNPAVEKHKKASKRRVRPWGIALLILLPLTAVASYVGYQWTHPAGITFRTVRVAHADITERVTATGTLQPVITSPIGAQVSGIVWKLHADFNSSVKAGQILVELDPSLFKNAVQMATAQLATAQANLASAQAVVSGAQRARDRTLTLEREALASDADLDAVEAIFGQTTGLARATAAQVAQARAQLDRAKLDLEHSIIRSPVNGTVISRNVDVGQAVASTLSAPTLFTIAQDLSQMLVHAAVDEADIGGVRPGQQATFTVDAFRNDVFNAVVHEVRNAPQTAQNVVTYDVVLKVENPEGKLRPGMTANVVIIILQKSKVVAVPNEALRFRPTAEAERGRGSKSAVSDGRPTTAVYIPQSGAATRVPVKAGVTDGNMTEIEGLELGSEVIIDIVRNKSKTPAAAGMGRGF